MSEPAPADVAPDLLEIDRLIRGGRRDAAFAGARRRSILAPREAAALTVVAAAGPPERSVRVCQWVVRVDPGSAQAYRNLSRALDAQHDGRASAALRRCLTLSPADGRALELMAERMPGPDGDRLLGVLGAVRAADPLPPFRRGTLRVQRDRNAAAVELLLDALHRQVRAENAGSARTIDAEATVYYALSGLLRRQDAAGVRRVLAQDPVTAYPALVAFFTGLLDLAEGRLQPGLARLSGLAGRTAFPIVDLLARFTPGRVAAAMAAAGQPAVAEPEWLVRGPERSGRPVMLVSSDLIYAEALLPALIETIPPAFGLHYHLLSKPGETAQDSAAVLDLVRRSGGSVTGETLLNENRTPMTTRRYEVLPALLAHYDTDVCVADADQVFGPQALERLVAGRGSVRLAVRSWWLPWIRYDANLVWFANDPMGRRVAAATSRLLRSIEPDTAPWFADQMALFAVFEHLAGEGFRPTNSLDYLTLGTSGSEDVVKLTAGPIAAKQAHLDDLRRQGFFTLVRPLGIPVLTPRR